MRQYLGYCVRALDRPRTIAMTSVAMARVLVSVASQNSRVIIAAPRRYVTNSPRVVPAMYHRELCK
jgi:hypothetical protein